MQAGHYPDVPPDFGHWLAGFIDGEGCFYLRATRKTGGMIYGTGFNITLRCDDEPILHEIRARTGLGRVYRGPNGERSRGARAWLTVFTKSECAALVLLLERYPLRAKKRRDFEIWSRAVREWMRKRHDGDRRLDWALMAQFDRELKACRRSGLDDVAEEFFLPALADDQLTLDD